MLALTHALLSTTLTALVTGKAEPTVLAIAACASQLPDLDITTSYVGRIFFPISRVLELRFPHRTITHSFLGTAIVALLGLPILFYSSVWYQALVWGFVFGWLGDTFTKSGAAAFYPGRARLVIPRNVDYRLATGSPAEYGVMVVFAIAFVIVININSSGGITYNFTQLVGHTQGAAQTYLEQRDNYLVFAKVKGHHLITGKPIEGRFEVIDREGEQLVLKTDQGLLKTGEHIETKSIRTIKDTRVEVETLTLNLLQESPEDVLLTIVHQMQPRTYVSGSLQLEYAEDLVLPKPAQSYATIRASTGVGVNSVTLHNASPAAVANLLGDYDCTGTLLIRIVKVNE